VSVCLGGTLTAIGLAHNAATGDRSIKSATFLNTLTDFSVPGALGVFTDEATIAGLEKQMAKKGFLDSDKMAHTFDALRANDLVFQYVANNWLLGNKPPASTCWCGTRTARACRRRCTRSTCGRAT